MIAESKALNFICDIKIFEIPFFQRGYVWGIENWEDLFNEMETCNTNHFLGSLILKKVENEDNSKPSKSIIIDGQQRLTTLSILLKAFYDSFSDEIRENIFDTIIKYLFYKEKETSSEYKIKINHSRFDNDDYKKVIGKLITENGHKTISRLTQDEINNIDDDTENDSTHKILKCYKYFYQRLLNIDEETKTTIFENIISENNQMLVVIHLGTSDKEQKIFDTINSAGVRLTTTDIIKNALFDALLETAASRQEIIDLYDETWFATFGKDNDAIGYWGTKKAQGRLYRENSEILLSAFALIKGIYDPYDKKQNMDDIPNLFKNHISSIVKENEKKEANKKLVLFLHEIIDYAKIYREKIIKFDKNVHFNYSNAQIKVIKTLDMMEVTALTPYILFLYKTYSNDNQRLNKEFELLYKFIMLRLINHESTSNYNKISKHLIQNSNYLQDSLKEFKDNKWIDGISKMNNKEARIVLFWLELYRRYQNKKIAEKELQDHYTLEHIMPVTWETNWSDVDVIDLNTNKKIENIEEARIYRKKAILSLGNMTLLISNVNSAVGNKSFEKKKPDYKLYGDNLSITKLDIIQNIMDKNIQWNEVEIKKRESNLKNELKRMFN